MAVLSRKKIQRRVLKKNPLKNLRIMIKLNPYAKTMRRNTILRHAQNVSGAAWAGAGRSGGALTDHFSLSVLAQTQGREESQGPGQAGSCQGPSCTQGRAHCQEGQDSQGRQACSQDQGRGVTVAVLPQGPRGGCARGLSLINVVGIRKAVSGVRVRAGVRTETSGKRRRRAAWRRPRDRHRAVPAAGSVTGGGRAGATAARRSGRVTSGGRAVTSGGGAVPAPAGTMLSRLQELRREEETLLRVKAALHDQLRRLRVRGDTPGTSRGHPGLGAALGTGAGAAAGPGLQIGRAHV